MKKLVFPPLSLFEASTAKVGRHPCSEFAVAPGKHLFFVHDEWVQPLLQKFAADSADYGCVSVRRAGSDGVQATTAATQKSGDPDHISLARQGPLLASVLEIFSSQPAALHG